MLLSCGRVGVDSIHLPGLFSMSDFSYVEPAVRAYICNSVTRLSQLVGYNTIIAVHVHVQWISLITTPLTVSTRLLHGCHIVVATL